MYPLVIKVLVSLCVLVSLSRALEANTKHAPCDISKQDVHLTLNCSHRNIEHITDWPQEMNTIDPDSHVLVTLYNNSVTNLTELPTIPANRFAFKFGHNKIIEIDDHVFKNVPGIAYLDLSNNHLTGQVLRSEIFQGPYKDGHFTSIFLETLILSYNEIHSLDKDLFQYTPKLTKLYLNNNPIEILDVVTVLAISSATRLQVLDLAYTDIESIPLDAFRGLLNLREIDLSGNKFVTVPPSLAVVGRTLEYLTFNNNPIVELNDDSFFDLTMLKELEVGNNDYLEEVKRSTFSPLKNLNVLHLCHNPNLRYISHNAFRGLKDKWTLQEVYLDDNNLSELSVDLMPWSKLEILGMTGNNWLCNCDLVNIVQQGAGSKFQGKVPQCAAPMSRRGAYITNITFTYCPTFDNTFAKNNSFTLSDLKPKHILWSIFGVALIVCIGMLCGLLVKFTKAFYNRNIRPQPVPYINLNSDSSFA